MRLVASLIERPAIDANYGKASQSFGVFFGPARYFCSVFFWSPELR